MLTAFLRTCFKDRIKTFPQGTGFNQQKMFLYPKYQRVEFANDPSIAADIGAARAIKQISLSAKAHGQLLDKLLCIIIVRSLPKTSRLIELDIEVRIHLLKGKIWSSVLYDILRNSSTLSN